ncbi:hypothetical protein [Nodosilinea sp. FACHB-13]|uniref:hypothetical protein n=1 Tax=Cyanophyceae TaxID=3028117 RepID=UPI00168A2541|nr:hypothetical protein [Nodosilinea sp. FACHB-13]MBD2109996.1 hypothetical protein [Nodosilinea sp. FACHB-13]
MTKLDCCDLCEYCAHSPYLVCAEHPRGVEGDRCPDFRMNTGAVAVPDDPLAWYGEEWQPAGASYYDSELVLDPVQRLNLEQRLEMLDTHPLFTSRCPNCEMPVPKATEGQIHWDCGHCGWADDSL